MQLTYQSMKSPKQTIIIASCFLETAVRVTNFKEPTMCSVQCQVYYIHCFQKYLEFKKSQEVNVINCLPQMIEGGSLRLSDLRHHTSRMQRASVGTRVCALNSWAPQPAIPYGAPSLALCLWHNGKSHCPSCEK